jgi:transcriptional regulator with XRE-family HTH domain
MFDQKLLGNRIKALRVQKGLSQDKFGELAGLNGKYLGEVERGNSNISITNLSKLAEVLEIPLLSLLAFNHEQSRPELLADLHHLLETADDTQLKIIHRLVEAVTR